MSERGSRGVSVERVLMVASSGGHLTQLCALEPWYAGRTRCWVTFDTQDAVSRLAGERVIWAHHPTTRNVKNFLRNLWLAWKVVRRERPQVIVSTGAGVALPFFVVGRLIGAITIFVEVVDRLDTATLTGRLCGPFSTLFLVQWPEQLDLYPRSSLIGRLM